MFGLFSYESAVRECRRMNDTYYDNPDNRYSSEPDESNVNHVYEIAPYGIRKKWYGWIVTDRKLS